MWLSLTYSYCLFSFLFNCFQLRLLSQPATECLSKWICVSGCSWGYLLLLPLIPLGWSLGLWAHLGSRVLGRAAGGRRGGGLSGWRVAKNLDWCIQLSRFVTWSFPHDWAPQQWASSQSTLSPPSNPSQSHTNPPPSFTSSTPSALPPPSLLYPCDYSMSPPSSWHCSLATLSVCTASPFPTPSSLSPPGPSLTPLYWTRIERRSLQARPIRVPSAFNHCHLLGSQWRRVRGWI